MKLNSCETCRRFIAKGMCPTCGPKSKLSAFATLLGGGAFAMTLMACYGCPPSDGNQCGRAYDPDAQDRRATPTPNEDELDASPDAIADHAAPENDAALDHDASTDAAPE